jgi:hypothetical protein
MEDNLNTWIVIILEGKGERKVIDRSGATVSLLGDLRIVPKARRLATFRRKIEFSGARSMGFSLAKPPGRRRRSQVRHLPDSKTCNRNASPPGTTEDYKKWRDALDKESPIQAPSLTSAARDGDGNMRSGRKNAREAGRRGVGMCFAISTPAVLPSVGRKTSAPLVLRRSIPRLRPPR